MNTRNNLLFQSLSANSWKAYQTAWRSYAKVLLQLGVRVHLPLQESLLELYVTAVSQRLAHTTIRSYLSAIKYMHIMAGHSLEGLFQDRLRLICRGIRRQQGNSKLRPRRLPISVDDLRDIQDWSGRNLPSYDAILLQAAVFLAFFGLLRVSEFTCPTTTSFDPNTHLGVYDVSFDHAVGLVRVHIKVSKSDPFRQGMTIRIARTGSHLCPFVSLVSFMRLRWRHGPGPLFVLSNGQFLTRDHIVYVLARVFPHIPAGRVGSHSFRIGGASRLCALGVPDATIQILGRWSSSAFKKYLHLSDQLVSELQSRMSKM